MHFEFEVFYVGKKSSGVFMVKTENKPPGYRKWYKLINVFGKPKLGDCKILREFESSYHNA